MTGNNLPIQQAAGSAMLEALSRHRCTGCGACCRWPGQVFLYGEDLRRISRRLHLTVDDFLLRWCVVARWQARAGAQFRIAIARDDSGGCLFLRGSLCGIHEFKPLACQAGPAGWPWIANPDFFWYYVDQSPSFRGPQGALPLAEANRWFSETRKAEGDASHARSIEALAALSGAPVEVLRKLPLVNFEQKENTMSGTPAPYEPPPARANQPSGQDNKPNSTPRATAGQTVPLNEPAAQAGSNRDDGAREAG